MVNGLEHQDEQGHNHHHDPGAVDELGQEEDREHQRGRQGAEAVDDDRSSPAAREGRGLRDEGRERKTTILSPLVPHLAPLVPLPCPPPVPYHARLRERERQEYAYGVEGDEPRGVALEHPRQQRREEGQQEDAVGEDQAVPQVGELLRQEAVAGHQARQAWEVGKRGVRGQHQNRRCRCLHEIVGPGHARVGEDGARELRDDRLFLARLDLVQVGQPAGAQKQDREQEGHPQQRRGGIPRLRRAEGGYAVRDRLHAGQGRTAVGESPQEE